MTTTTQPELMTTEQLDAIPDDGRERWLINGELREGEMTRRNRGHSRVSLKIGHLLYEWLETRPKPRGEIVGGEAGIILRHEPDTSVGVDVAYISPETAAANPDELGYIDGPPVLAVEVLSPSDKHDAVTEKVDLYLECGVKFVWVVDPAFRTITVYRPDAEPELFNVNQELAADPHLPGFRVAVRDVFSR